MAEFKYAPMFQLGKDDTEYRLVSKEGISVGEFEGKEILKVSKEALTLLAQEAFQDSDRPRGIRERQVRSTPVSPQC